MEDRLLKLLEYDKVSELVSAYAVSDDAKDAILNMRPSFDIAEISRMQETTEQAILIRDKYLIGHISAPDNVLPILTKAEVGVTLNPSDLLKIAALLKLADNAKRSIMLCGDDVENIKEYVEFLMPNMALAKRIDATIAGENEIRDSASDTLRTIRRKIIGINNKLKDKLNSFIHSHEHEKFLQDSIITVREGRFVLPVKSECRANIPGLIHDRSASGSTVFVEPFSIVEMNNDLKSLQAAERDEIERILSALTAEVAADRSGISVAYAQLTALDIIYAKAAYSSAIKGHRPLLNAQGEVDLKNCRHPLIDSDKVVPVDIALGKDFSILVITGPNTGGKTVCLKTLGLLCLMAYSGLKIPCDEDGKIGVFDNIFCDIGDEQSIEHSLSTFSSHITNVIAITDSVTPDSLVLLDEVGAGTDPAEGSALAIGILKYLELINCHGIVTTHYSELKEYALISSKLMNACMQFDEKTMTPTYRLIIGLPGVSNALSIAGKLGINEYILKAARESVKEEKIQFERVLQNAENVKAQALSELDEINALKLSLQAQQREQERVLSALNAKLAQINNNAKLETQKLIRKAEEKANDIIEQMKEKMRVADENALIEAKRLQRQIDTLSDSDEGREIHGSYIDLPLSQVKIGTVVLIKSLNQSGTIIALTDKRGLIGVQSGAMKLSLPLSDLAQTTQPKPSKSSKVSQKKPRKVPDETAEENSDSAPVEELKVMGMTVSEAIAVIEPRLVTAAAQTPKPILKIVHGKGTGALGKGIQNYCHSSPLVKSYRYGRYGEGESGVTFIEIK